MKTKAQAKKWINSKIGTGTDWDGMYGFQCMDLAVAYMNYVTDGKVTMWGNAKDAIKNSFGDTAKIIKNTPSFEPKVGDVAVWTTGNFSTYGHIAIVVDGNPNNDLQTFKSLDQNWFGGGLAKTELAQIITHNYDGVTHFIRPNFKAEPKKTTPKKETAKKPASKPATSKKKGKTLKYNRDEVKGYKLPKRGYKPKFIVIHNDAGNASAMQYRQSLVNAPLSRLENGIAHSYISGDTVWQALPEGRVAWHTGENTGNTNGYGIEVCQSMSASDKDFLNNEQSTFQEAARMLKKWGLPVNRSSVKLHMEFVSTACPHRSMKLHTGWDPVKQGRPSQATINKLKDYFISQIKQYYKGEIPKGSTVSGSKPSPSTTKPVSTANNGWQLNQYGAWWKKESATFTCGGAEILARIDAPSLQAAEGYWFQPGGYTPYDEVCLRDGHCWIGYNWQGVRYYLPVRLWDGTPPPNHRPGLGPKWGTFS